MKKNLTDMFVLLSMLLHFLHVIRGPELIFTMDGRFPYILYYGAMILYVLCFLYYSYLCVKRLCAGRKKKPKK